MKRSSSGRSGCTTAEELLQSKQEQQKRTRRSAKSSTAKFDATVVNSNEAPPLSTTQQRVAPKLPPAPFLQCHLSMLEALHKDDCDDEQSRQSVQTDLKREEDDLDHREKVRDNRSMMWDYVTLFLNRRENLVLNKAKAIRLRGILEEATLVSKNPKEEDGCGGGGSQIGIDGGGRHLHEESTVVPPSSSMTNNINDNENNNRMISLSFITQSQSSATVFNNNGSSANQHPILSFTSLTSPSKKMPIKTEQFSPFSFHSNFQGRSRSRSRSRRTIDHRISEDNDGGDDGVKSLNLVMRIMEKRCAVADSLSEREMKPFLPLAKAVVVKIKELDEALETLLHERRKGFVADREEDRRDSFAQADGSFWDGTPSQYCVDDDDDNNLDHSIERIAKIQNKLWLWNLLSRDLRESMH